MRFYCAIVTLVLGSVFLDPGRVRSDDEKVFAPKNGMFTITMPEGDTSSDKTKILTIGKHKVPIESSRSGLKDGTTFQGSSMGIPAVVMRDIPADKRFDVLRDALVKQLNGKVTDEKDVMKDPIPGKEYTIELPKGVVRMQLYTVTGWVVYAIIEGKTKDDVSTKQSDAFFDSLIFSDNAKDLFRKVKR